MLAERSVLISPSPALHRVSRLEVPPMPIPKRPLFLAGLLLAAACSDDGSPVAADGAGEAARPESAPAAGIEVACTVDEVAGRVSCTPASAQTGDALGAISIG